MDCPIFSVSSLYSGWKGAHTWLFASSGDYLFYSLLVLAFPSETVIGQPHEVLYLTCTCWYAAKDSMAQPTQASGASLCMDTSVSWNADVSSTPGDSLPLCSWLRIASRQKIQLMVKLSFVFLIRDHTYNVYPVISENSCCLDFVQCPVNGNGAVLDNPTLLCLEAEISLMSFCTFL